MTTIPKVIHQVWKTDLIPVAWREHVLSWRRRHPGWRFMLWTDDDARRFVADRFAEFLPVYEGFSYDIERADAIRYLVLLELGGVYVDLDIECLRPVDELLTGRRAVLASELPVHAGYVGRTEMVSNAFMAAAPGHPLFRCVLERLSGVRPRAIYHGEVLTGTGPLMLTDLLARHPDLGVTVLAPQVINPVANGSREMHCLRLGGSKADAIRRQVLADGAYGIHWFSNSWVRNLAGPLCNPTPHDIPGYRFHPGLDSPGGDIGNAGRDIRRLAALATADGDVVGFNTDGYMKSRLRPRFRWIQMWNAGPNEGLYVKVTSTPLARLRSWLGAPGSGAKRATAGETAPASRRTGTC